MISRRALFRFVPGLAAVAVFPWRRAAAALRLPNVETSREMAEIILSQPCYGDYTMVTGLNHIEGAVTIKVWADGPSDSKRELAEYAREYEQAIRSVFTMPKKVT